MSSESWTPQKKYNELKGEEEKERGRERRDRKNEKRRCGYYATEALLSSVVFSSMHRQTEEGTHRRTAENLQEDTNNFHVSFQIQAKSAVQKFLLISSFISQLT